MNSFLSFFRNLFSSPVKRMPTDRLFADWDLWEYDKLRDHFELEVTAKKNASKNSPITSALTPDYFHNDLTSRYEKIVNEKTLVIITQLDILETRSEKAQQQLNLLDDIKSLFTNRLNQDLETLRPAITAAESKAISRREELKVFKERNNLTRDASYPDSSIWHFFVLFGLVVIESIINGVMFQEGSRAGYLGGVSIAVLISLINVAAGFLVGAYWGKLSWSIHQLPKYAGYLGFGIWGIFTIWFNLLVGHIRTIYEQGFSGSMAEVSAQGWINFQASPFGLTDFFSWLLVLIGTLFAIIALFDGIRFDDAYPGYGREFRKHLSAEEELQDEKDNLNITADRYYDEFKDSGDTAISDLSETSSDLRSKYDYVVGVIDTQYPNYCDYYANIFTRLIEDYRNINHENREDDPPAYFRSRPELTWQQDNRSDQLQSLDDRINNIAQSLSEASSKWVDDRGELEDIKINFLETFNDPVS
tara:strand:+ start:1759 stop:3183 length:1425 start_codon:yes stop_codon:yes gene_type:complete